MSELETEIVEFGYGEVTLFYMDEITVDGISGERGSSISRRMFNLLPTEESPWQPRRKSYFYIADFDVDEEEWLRYGNILNKEGESYDTILKQKGMYNR